MHWRLSTILKTSKKCMKQCFLICKSMYNLLHWSKTQMLKIFPSDRTSGTKNALFYLSWASAHHSSTFNSRFLYQLRHKFFLSEIVGGICHFRFRFVFIFVQQKVWTLWRHSLFQNYYNRKATHTFFPGLCFLSCNNKFKNSNSWICVSSSSQRNGLEINF